MFLTILLDKFHVCCDANGRYLHSLGSKICKIYVTVLIRIFSRNTHYCSTVYTTHASHYPGRVRRAKQQATPSLYCNGICNELRDCEPHTFRPSHPFGLVTEFYSEHCDCV